MVKTRPRHRKNITLDDLREVFELPLEEAAQKLNISTSSLKRLCREYKIPKWPFRKVSALQTKIYKFSDLQYPKKN